MITRTKKLFLQFEEEFNSVPCKHCGRQHRISLSFPQHGDMPVITYSTDICQESYNEVVQRVNGIITDFGYPFP